MMNPPEPMAACPTCNKKIEKKKMIYHRGNQCMRNQQGGSNQPKISPIMQFSKSNQHHRHQYKGQNIRIPAQKMQKSSSMQRKKQQYLKQDFFYNPQLQLKQTTSKMVQENDTISKTIQQKKPIQNSYYQKTNQNNYNNNNNVIIKSKPKFSDQKIINQKPYSHNENTNSKNNYSNPDHKPNYYDAKIIKQNEKFYNKHYSNTINNRNMNIFKNQCQLPYNPLLKNQEQRKVYKHPFEPPKYTQEEKSTQQVYKQQKIKFHNGKVPNSETYHPPYNNYNNNKRSNKEVQANVAMRQANAAVKLKQRMQSRQKQSKNNSNNYEDKYSNTNIYKKQKIKVASKSTKQNQTVLCQNCLKPIPIQKINEHESLCGLMDKCEYCAQQFPLQLIQEHELVCEIKNMILKPQIPKKKKSLKKNSNANNGNIDANLIEFWPNQAYQDQHYYQQYQNYPFYNQNQANIVPEHFPVPIQKPKKVGLTKTKLNNLNLTSYKGSDKGELGQECAICYMPFNENQTIMNLKCKHIFHPDCVGKWFQSDNTCPMCKKKVA